MKVTFSANFKKMTSSQLKTQQKTILHFWNIGFRSAKDIHKATKIPMRTIYNHLKKLKKISNVDHKKVAGRPKKITPNVARYIGQTIRHDSTISLRSIKTKLAAKTVDVSHTTIATHLTGLGYNKSCQNSPQC